MSTKPRSPDLYVGVTQTAIGPVAVLATKTRPLHVILNARALKQVRRRFPDARPDTGQLAPFFKMIDDALAGRKPRLPLGHLGAGDFNVRVWEAARAIPAGKVASYGALARRIGHPRAARAVGAALGANPLPILVPCHRIVRADGSLGGFGAGLPLKIRLLHHELVPLHQQRVDPSAFVWLNT